ncbi:TRAP transporter large permease [Vreelandella maris]|uniref:TRAP transporter large permease protein n=1 Tax=Vreelandella maris TaxID=2729617 RepID=A0A7Y6RF46_9GAMM|nr:TRAP transporter large permease [Halomonas maris]NVF15814.1 TRAP transporter large permease [Halomonas maris]|tara:strand:- start:3657 stop:4928 length:1272 start_codon:yes stop_codon:yes gene_type:complete
MLLFIFLGILLILGMPVGFAIGIASMLFLFLVEGPLSPNVIALRMISGVDSFPLLALPLFMLAGELMKYGTTPRLMRLANALFGFMRGGLAGVAVASTAFFGSISGSGVATVAAVGSIVQPEMTRKGYGKGFSASLVAGGGVLGMVIPPSMAMVVYGVSAGVSIGALFLAGILPGLLTAVMLIIYGVCISRRRNYGGQGGGFELRELGISARKAVLPLLLPIIILGGVMTGIFTPTESAVVAVVYAFILAFIVYRELKLKDLVGAVTSSAITSAVILFIIATANPFGWIMAIEQIPNALSDLLSNLTDNHILQLILISLMLLIMGTFMETIATIIIMTPILVPIALSIGLNPVHFGVLMMMNLAIGGVTPPLAVGLFTAAKISAIRIEETFPDVLYVLLVMIAAYALVLFIPSIAMFIPEYFS